MKITRNRTPNTHEAYLQFLRSKTPKEQEKFVFDLSPDNVIHEYTHWVFIPNDYPYDAIFSKHNLIVPKRIIALYTDATPQEHQEFLLIKGALANKYDAILENFPKGRSVKAHWHAHLFNWIYYT